MKKYLGTIATLALALVTSIGGVDAATSTREIDASACETVYTNYYFFLDANTTDYFNQSRLSEIAHTNIAVYRNNSYQIDNFDPKNVGYGQVAVSRTTTTSSDGITSMSLSDYYTHYLYAMNLSGAYTIGSNNYIAAHDWYRVGDDDSMSKGASELDLRKYTKKSLMNASLDAYSTFTRQSSISPSAPNPFQVRVDRQYFGFLTGYPLTNGEVEWYLQPAIYYVQYCSPKKVEAPSTYTVSYKSNTTDAVSNMPQDVTISTELNTYISSNIPVRNGYTFLGWSTDANATFANSNYNSGSLYTDRKDLVLYAIWKLNDTPSVPNDPNLPENPQTAVTDYLLPFGGVISASGVGLGLLKKKKTFKQF